VSAPIKREDIRKGDRIAGTTEFTASEDWFGMAGDNTTYELIERPVVLPTEPGWYFDKDGEPWQVTDSSALSPTWAPYTRIQSRAEVAAEVLADVLPQIKQALSDITSLTPGMTTRDIFRARSTLASVIEKAEAK